MSYRLLADIIVVIHFAFVVFVVVGGLLGLRWPKVLWVHVPAVIYSAVIVTWSITCPLTPLERDLRTRGGEEAYGESFIERYVEGVLYPGGLLDAARAVAALVVVGSWIAVAMTVRRRSARASRQEVDDGEAPGARSVDGPVTNRDEVVVDRHAVD